MARRKKNEQVDGGFVPANQQTRHKPHRGALVSTSVPEVGGGRHGVPENASKYSRAGAQYAGRKPQKRSVGKIVAVVIIIVLLLAAIGGLGAYIFIESKKAEINNDLHSSFSKAEMQAVDNELTGMTKFDEPFTILLLGTDAREDDPDMGARSDTIILARIDPINNVVNMVSIPRDTKINIDGYGTQKFNAAYTFGGPSGTIAAVKNLCGVDIDHYAEINFEGLEDLVDAVGGIDIDVEGYVDDPEAGPSVLEPGEQHLDGEAALTYARSRHAFADGDFARARHQRQVIEGVIHRLMTAKATDLYGLIKVSTSFLTTDSNMDVDFIFSLADQVRHNENSLTMHNATIPSSTATIDGISYVIADDAGVAAMMDEFMANGDVSFGETETVEATNQSSSAAAASASGESASAASSGSAN